jgi:hypothetical protein
MSVKTFAMLLGLLLAGSQVTLAADAPSSGAKSPGKIELQSGGPLAFALDGVLLLADPMAATVYAVETGDKQGDAKSVKHEVADLRGKIAALVGASTDAVQINDLAVNPASGNVFISVTRGSGPAAQPLVLKLEPSGKLAELELDGLAFTKAELANAPASGEGRRGNPRMMTVTDLAFIDGKVYIAGLSNEEFASKLRTIPFPFTAADDGSSVEIFHGAHGRVETNSPIMTFAAFEIDNQPHVVAAYTCTPLVKFNVADLKPEAKVRGVTVAELGNRNRPLDMFVYEKEGKDYILLSNSNRGLMKIDAQGIGSQSPINEKIDDKAGLSYETIEVLKGVVQLDRLSDGTAVALIQGADGKENLQTIELP